MPIYFPWFTKALLSVGGDASDQNLPQSGRLLYCVIIPVIDIYLRVRDQTREEISPVTMLNRGTNPTRVQDQNERVTRMPEDPWRTRQYGLGIANRFGSYASSV